MSGDSSFRDFVSSVEVVYSNDRPADVVNEIEGRSSEINCGQGGETVWLRVHRPEQPGPLINNFWIDIGDHQAGLLDLSKGCGGKYRYLKWSSDPVQCPVTEVALWRPDDKQNSAPQGWDGKSQDINIGRGGDYLYLVWKVKPYHGHR